ncbi:hypothetical protein K435DRAFT_675997 [Dendrothele bispora CBS 962.96]|uniref:Uncharacterized protein n=1 Tax=Dendrothele bispora (strain CBS 962.96) TaxID=1314807 RepID=A0A4S8LN04_DENBC|nr:hypothetical protein K435DRAFT_675997 [Dendrothele bispora CBS 962.96]
MIPTLSSTSSSLAYYSAGLLGFVSFASYASYALAKHWNLRNRRWDALKEKLDQKEVELQRLRESLNAVEEDNRRKEEALHGMRLDLEEKQMEISEARGRNTTLEEKMAKVVQELASVSEEKRRLTDAHGTTVQLLEVRSLELRGAQEFLTRTDRYSGTDVMKMIQALNSEILQTAATMAELFGPQLNKSSPRAEYPSSSTAVAEPASENVKNAIEHTEDILGPQMTSMLWTFDHQDEPILLQIAFQASMCAFAEWIIDSWLFHARDSELLLQEVYERLRETEEHAVSGRWRILTRKYVRELFPERPDLPSHFFAAFVNILVVAGMKQSQDAIQETLKSHFSKKIDVLVENAVCLNSVVGDDFTSCELLPVYCSPEIQFDASSMDNTFGDVSSPDEPILCTTDLGLVRAERVQGKVGEWSNLLLLKPKVILQSGLSEIGASAEEAV